MGVQLQKKCALIGGNKLVLVNDGGDADAALAVQGVPADDPPLATDADAPSLAHLRRKGHGEFHVGRQMDSRIEGEVDALGADVVRLAVWTADSAGSDFRRGSRHDTADAAGFPPLQA